MSKRRPGQAERALCAKTRADGGLSQEHTHSRPTHGQLLARTVSAVGEVAAVKFSHP